MAMKLTDPRFHDAEKARQWLEAQRWPDGPVCSHCGSLSATALHGKAHRPGLYQCNDCREQFTVTTGSVMERSKIPLNKWVLAMHLMGSSKKGMSAHQLHRMLGITYQSAWFLAHRIREAMKDTTATHGPLGGEGKVVEADELYYGQRETPRVSPNRTTPYTKKGKAAEKRVILGLVERGGKVRTFHVQDATTASIAYVVRQNVSRESQLQTDEHRSYIALGQEFKGGHETVTHARNE
jgi:transposase-like protein